MQNLNDLFEHELKDVYGAEKQILQTIRQMVDETRDPQMKRGLEQHARETEGQIRRIEQVFQGMQTQVRDASCPTIEGLVREKKNFQEKSPPAEMVDVFNLGATMKTEHYEIAAYTGLLNLAKQVGMEDVAAPLRENLEEERRMLQRAEEMAGRVVGNGGQRQGGNQQGAQTQGQRAGGR